MEKGKQNPKLQILFSKKKKKKKKPCLPALEHVPMLGNPSINFIWPNTPIQEYFSGSV